METTCYKKLSFVNKLIVLCLAALGVAFPGCATYHRLLPCGYDGLRKLESYNSGNIFLLHVGQLTPSDSVSIFINSQEAVLYVSTNFPYPTEVYTNSQGEPNKCYYDFILTKKKHIITLTTLKDPKKKILFSTKFKDTIDITVLNNYGDSKSFYIPENMHYFMSFRFMMRPDGSLYTDTIRGIRYFD